MPTFHVLSNNDVPDLGHLTILALQHRFFFQTTTRDVRQKIWLAIVGHVSIEGLSGRKLSSGRRDRS
jgi:hypothetical protein